MFTIYLNLPIYIYYILYLSMLILYLSIYISIYQFINLSI